MSRFRTVFFVFTLLFAWSPPALAADDQEAEMVYRASLGRADDVRLLLSQKVSPDSKNDKGVPVLALASARKDLEGLNVVQALVEGGAAVDAHDAGGQTALFYAAKQGNVPIVTYLLSKKASSTAIDTSGNQPRMVAYLAGQKDVVEALDAFVVQNANDVRKQAQQEQTEKQLQAVQKQNEALRQQLEEKSKPEPMSNEAQKVAADLAFSSCAFQYWSYCSSEKQSTELSAEQLESIIASTQEQSESLKTQLSQDYKIGNAQVNNVLLSAQRRIYNELSDMPSNIERHEQGVGKRSDMTQRCEKIAKSWDAPPPSLQAPQQILKAPQASVKAKPKPQAKAAAPEQPPAKLRKIADDFVIDLNPKNSAATASPR